MTGSNTETSLILHSKKETKMFMFNMLRNPKNLIAMTLLAAAGSTVYGSSHREALAVLNEPCADNTDTYAWVKPGTHDKLYLIMNFNPLKSK